MDNFCKYTWNIPLKNKNSKTITEEVSKTLTKSKRSELKLESDRDSEFYNSVFQNLLKGKNIHYCSRFTGKAPSIAKRVIRTRRNLLKKPVFEEGNADWLNELPSVIKQNKNKIQSSKK